MVFAGAKHSKSQKITKYLVKKKFASDLVTKLLILYVIKNILIFCDLSGQTDGFKNTPPSECRRLAKSTFMVFDMKSLYIHTSKVGDKH